MEYAEDIGGFSRRLQFNGGLTKSQVNDKSIWAEKNLA
jgi:hypothetical protein